MQEHEGCRRRRNGIWDCAGTQKERKSPSTTFCSLHAPASLGSAAQTLLRFTLLPPSSTFSATPTQTVSILKITNATMTNFWAGKKLNTLPTSQPCAISKIFGFVPRRCIAMLGHRRKILPNCRLKTERPLIRRGMASTPGLAGAPIWPRLPFGGSHMSGTHISASTFRPAFSCLQHVHQ